MHWTVFAPGKVPGGHFPNTVRGAVFNNFELIEPKQDFYVLVFIQLKRRNDVLKTSSR